jgi:hypothetical protein
MQRNERNKKLAFAFPDEAAFRATKGAHNVKD